MGQTAKDNFSFKKIFANVLETNVFEFSNFVFDQCDDFFNDSKEI